MLRAISDSELLRIKRALDLSEDKSFLTEAAKADVAAIIKAGVEVIPVEEPAAEYTPQNTLGEGCV